MFKLLEVVVTSLLARKPRAGELDGRNAGGGGQNRWAGGLEGFRFCALAECLRLERQLRKQKTLAWASKHPSTESWLVQVQLWQTSRLELLKHARAKDLFVDLPLLCQQHFNQHLPGSKTVRSAVSAEMSTRDGKCACRSKTDALYA